MSRRGVWRIAIGKLMGATAATVLAAFIPGFEVKVGIPLGVAMGLPIQGATAAAIAGNIMQTHVAILAVAQAYRYCHTLPRMYAWLQRLEARVQRHGRLIERFGWVGLAGYVILPLPASGVWGGVVLAQVIRLSTRGTWLGISVGVAVTGVLYALGMQGAFSLFDLVRKAYP